MIFLVSQVAMILSLSALALTLPAPVPPAVAPLVGTVVLAPAPTPSLPSTRLL